MFKSHHFSYVSGLLFFIFSIAAHAQPHENIFLIYPLVSLYMPLFCWYFESFCINGKVSNFFQVEGQKNQIYVID